MKNILSILLCMLLLPQFFLSCNKAAKDKEINIAIHAKESAKKNKVRSFEIVKRTEIDGLLTVTYKAKCIHAGRDGYIRNIRVLDSVTLSKTEEGIYTSN